MIDALLEKANTILIGGAMAYTFGIVGQQGRPLLCEADKVETAKAALAKAKVKGVKFLPPIDHVITDKVDFAGKATGELKVVEGNIPDGFQGVDIGPKTVALYSKEIAASKTVPGTARWAS